MLERWREGGVGLDSGVGAVGGVAQKSGEGGTLGGGTEDTAAEAGQGKAAAVSWSRGGMPPGRAPRPLGIEGSALTGSGEES